MDFIKGLLGLGNSRPLAEGTASAQVGVTARAKAIVTANANAYVNATAKIIGMENGAVQITIKDSLLGVVVIILLLQQPDPSGNIRFLLLSGCCCVAATVGAIIYKGPEAIPPEIRINLIAPTRLLLIGNPGGGKSTILNGLIGKHRFDSGPAFGGTLTKVFQSEKDSNGNFLVDTPGLADFKTRGQAAYQITAAMKENSAHGTMKLIFVVKLDTGRVRATDTVTIQLVLEALPENTPYGIIVNHIEPNVYEELFSNHYNFQELCVCLNQGRQNKTTLIHFIECDGKLTGCRNAVPASSNVLKTFINEITYCRAIAGEAIEEVRSMEGEAELEEIEAEHNRKLRQLEKDGELMSNEMKKMADQYEDEQKELRDQFRNEQAGDKDVGPIWSNADAPTKARRWIAKNPGWKWNGHWVTRGSTSYAGMIRST